MNFRPVQIFGMLNSPEFTGYREYLPDDKLSEFVVCYWFFRRTSIEGDILVNPDCCSDIIFDLSYSSASCFAEITGVFSEKIYVPGSGVEACGVRLKPGIAYHLIKEGIDSLGGTTVRADNYRFIDASFAAENMIGKTDSQIVSFLNSYFYGIFSKLMIRETRFICASKIFDAVAAGREEDVGISGKTANRYCLKYFGMTRKKISSVIRFQKSIKDILRNGRIVPEGYCDQPHFIHEFKRFSGLTPGDFIDFAENIAYCPKYTIHSER